MIDHFNHRLVRIENKLSRRNSAPTFPIYDQGDLPQDALSGQVVIGIDESINWFDGSWHTMMGSPTTGITPIDPVQGQIAISSDHSLCWFINDVWHGLVGALSSGGPQDPLEGQVAISKSDATHPSICWFSDGNWYCAALPVNIYGRVKETWKTHPVWWNLDDTYNGNTAWVGTGGAGDVSYIAKFNGSSWDYWTGQGIQGVWTPGHPAPGTPYYPSGPVPVGGVGNSFNTFLDPAFSAHIVSGDQYAVVAYRLDALNSPAVSWSSIPYFEDHFILYENDGTTVIHDFGALQIDLTAYNPPPSAFPPGFYLPPSSNFFLGTIWTVT